MILLELVPRELEQTASEAVTLLDQFKQLSGINVPDVRRLTNRSYVVAERLLDQKIEVVPHIKSIDNSLEKTVEIVCRLQQKGLRQALIVTGDPPPDLSCETYPITPMQVVESVKERCPDLKLYCALDPYRQSFKKELQYCRNKLRAGADGFFTQPFFDPDLARIYIEQLEDCDVFVGISPVISERSYHYWITRNHAIFPKRFQLTLEGNVEIGREIMAQARHAHKSIYLMPIKVPAEPYLAALLAE